MASELTNLHLRLFRQMHDLQLAGLDCLLFGSVKDAVAWRLTCEAGAGVDESATLLPEYNNLELIVMNTNAISVFKYILRCILFQMT